MRVSACEGWLTSQTLHDSLDRRLSPTLAVPTTLFSWPHWEISGGYLGPWRLQRFVKGVVLLLSLDLKSASQSYHKQPNVDGMCPRDGVTVGLTSEEVQQRFVGTHELHPRRILCS